VKANALVDAACNLILVLAGVANILEAIAIVDCSAQLFLIATEQTSFDPFSGNCSDARANVSNS